MISAPTAINGARTMTRIIIMTASWTCSTSLVSRVTSAPVCSRSRSAWASVWTLRISAPRRSAPIDSPARLANTPQPNPNPSPRTATAPMIAASRSVHAASPSGNASSMTICINRGCSRSMATSSVINTGAASTHFQ